MEILIAILWYLQVIFAGHTYSPDQINKYINANQPVIQEIQKNQNLTKQVMNQFNQQCDVKLNNQTGSIDVWEEDEEPEPIPN